MEIPHLGIGIGYRPPLHDYICSSAHISWVEVIAEHYMRETGKPESGAALRQTLGMPVIPHGIEMSIGSLDTDTEWRKYLEELALVVDLFDAPWSSDHLCFTKTAQTEIATLTPLPRTRDVADHVARRARQVSASTGRPFLIENIAYHFAWGDEMTETQFITSIVEAADCYLLLDLTNLSYNALNHGFDAISFIDSIPVERVVQVHLAGGVTQDDLHLDTHSEPVPDHVWPLLEHLARSTRISGVMLERDQRLEELDEISTDLSRASEIIRGVDHARKA